MTSWQYDTVVVTRLRALSLPLSGSRKLITCALRVFRRRRNHVRCWGRKTEKQKAHGKPRAARAPRGTRAAHRKIGTLSSDINKHKTNNGRTLHAPIRHQHSMTGTRVARCAYLSKSFSNLPPPKPRLGELAQASAQCCMHLRAPPSSRQGQGGSGGLGVGGGAGATTRPCWRRRTLRTPWRSSPS